MVKWILPVWSLRVGCLKVPLLWAPASWMLDRPGVPKLVACVCLEAPVCEIFNFHIQLSFESVLHFTATLDTNHHAATEISEPGSGQKRWRELGTEGVELVWLVGLSLEPHIQEKKFLSVRTLDPVSLTGFLCKIEAELKKNTKI